MNERERGEREEGGREKERERENQLLAFVY